MANTDIKAKLILSNIQNYKVDNKDCENICLKAMNYGIGRVLVQPSSVPLVKKLLAGSAVSVGVAISYPSGAYFADAKAEEIAEQVDINPEVAEFYVVMAVGRYLSGYTSEAEQEMRVCCEAAAGRDVYFVLESAVLSAEQLAEIAAIAKKSGIKGLVDTTGFRPYDIPFPTAADTKKTADAAHGLKVIANGLLGSMADAEEKMKAGADEVIIINCDF